MIITVDSAVEQGLIGKVTVKLNGKTVKKCIFADDKKGAVEYYLNPLRLDKHGDRAITQRRRGKVQIIIDNG